MSVAMMLREGTAQKHEETEKVPYIRAIFRGGLDAQTYTYQLESLLAVYQVMEELYRENKDNPILSKLYFPSLFREKALKEDIESFQKSLEPNFVGKFPRPQKTISITSKQPQKQNRNYWWHKLTCVTWEIYLVAKRLKK